MSTITTLNESDRITDSRAVINDNFSALNTDKIETSYLDTDTTLAANSDTKIPSQKAVKAYVDSGGALNASETVRGLVEEATDAEVTAGTATGGTGAKLFLTPAKFSTFITTANYLSKVGTGGTTRDLSTASGNQTIAHGLGVVPRMVRIVGVYAGFDAVNKAWNSYTETTYIGTTQSSIFVANSSSSVGGSNTGTNGNAFRLYFDIPGLNNYQTGVITTDATNITIAWTKTGSPSGTANLIWEAFY